MASGKVDFAVTECGADLAEHHSAHVDADCKQQQRRGAVERMDEAEPDDHREEPTGPGRPIGDEDDDSGVHRDVDGHQRRALEAHVAHPGDGDRGHRVGGEKREYGKVQDRPPAGEARVA